MARFQLAGRSRGVRRGAKWGSDLGPFQLIWPNHVYPIRARAYNDLSKQRVLLKTRSRGGIHGPQNGPILGPLKMARGDGVTCYPSVSVYSVYV